MRLRMLANLSAAAVSETTKLAAADVTIVTRPAAAARKGESRGTVGRQEIT